MNPSLNLRSIFDNVATCSLILTFGLLVIIGVLSYNSTQRFLDNDRKVIRTYRVINDLGTVLSDLQDAETGQRGYLLTGKSSYLQPYLAGRTAVPGDIMALKGLLATETAQKARLLELETVSQDKLAELDLTVTLRERSQSSSALALVDSDRGQALMIQARALVGRMQSEEQRLLVDRTSEADSSGVMARVWGILGSLLAIVLIGIAVSFVSRYLRQRGVVEAENIRLVSAARDAALRQRMFLKDVLSSVTEGRLALCDTVDELPSPLSVEGETVPLAGETGSGPLRQAAEAAARRCGFEEEKVQDLVTSVSEAGTNAITHGGGGHGIVRTNGTDWVQVWIIDHGKGIPIEELPQSTLDRGYSTAGTLGHGFWLMLQMCHRVSLLTDPTGTTVVLEQAKDNRDAPWMRRRTRSVAWSFHSPAVSAEESGPKSDISDRVFRSRTF